MEAQWWREYEYRRAFGGLTHEQYLDEPNEAVQWLTRIHQTVEQARADKERESRG